ncbi:MAG: DUF1830 domain-containing protein [Cyanobacteria bacterium J06642_2]
MQIIDSLPTTLDGKRVTCVYVNSSSSIQIARITNVKNWYFERVVFPGQRLMFEAVPDATVEIHTGMMASAILDDTFLCRDLAVDDENVRDLVTAGPVKRAS